MTQDLRVILTTLFIEIDHVPVWSGIDEAAEIVKRFCLQYQNGAEIATADAQTLRSYLIQTADTCLGLLDLLKGTEGDEAYFIFKFEKAGDRETESSSAMLYWVYLFEPDAKTAYNEFPTKNGISFGRLVSLTSLIGVYSRPSRF